MPVLADVRPPLNMDDLGPAAVAVAPPGPGDEGESD